jgi:hypothetical protein
MQEYSPCLSMLSVASRSTANRENSQTFSFGLAGLGLQEGAEGGESLSRARQPLVVAEMEKIETCSLLQV